MTDPELIAGLSQKDRKVAVRYLYDSFLEKSITYLKSLNASDQEAEDIFQEVALALIKQLSSKPLVLTDCSFQHYLFVMCFNQWTKVLRRKKREIPVTFTRPMVSGNEAEVERLLESIELRAVIQTGFAALGLECRQLMKLFLHSEQSQREIAKSLQQEYANVRQKITRCRNKLRTVISQNPSYREIKNQ